MDRILVTLGKPIKACYTITSEEQTVIDEIVNNATEAQQARIRKKQAKDAKSRATEATIAELLDNPAGLSRAELLGAADSENIISLVLRLKHRLKQSNIYTLGKRTQNKVVIYFLKYLH